MELVLDRFEGGYAILQERVSGRVLSLEKSLIPSEAREGDIFEYDGENFLHKKEETTETYNRLRQMFNRLKK